MVQKTLTTSKTQAEHFAKELRSVSVSEFFSKNRHLLGFDNPSRALLMTVKEAVDNALDACYDLRIPPEIKVELKQISEKRFSVSVEDNGPGIVREQVPNVFGRLLYGSKFHRLKQNRGSQGIGISAVSLYSQLTTGKPTRITSKISPRKPAHYFELILDTKQNEPKIVKDKETEWENKKTGTKVEIELIGKYQKGKQSVDEYIKQVAIVNPAAQITYITPEKKTLEFPRVTTTLPVEPKEIKPHPHGVELGNLIRMLHDTKYPTVKAFLQNEFSRLSSQKAKEICQTAKIYEKSRPKTIVHKDVENLYSTIQETKFKAPPTDCLSPIGQKLLEKGLKSEVSADFYATVTRPPAVYRGNPFQIEVGIAYGGDIDREGTIKLLRFANTVPLLYQQGACAITKAVSTTNWKSYGLQQSNGNLPAGPVILIVHMASVWVPFTSEAKDAVASYNEITKEIKLALQECGRQLGIYIRRKVKSKEREQRISLFENYIPELASSLSHLTGEKKEKLIINLSKTLEKELPRIK